MACTRHAPAILSRKLAVTPPIMVLLVVVAVALVLFWFEWVPADVTALGVLLALVVLDLVPPEEAFAGFGSDTVILLLGLLVMTAALVRTGVLDLLSRRLLGYTGDRPWLLLPAVMLAVAALSTVINNTAAAALFLPVVLSISSRTGRSASRLLMPMAFAAILSSSTTLIATSTNLVVSGLMTQAGLEPIGMFELTPVGLPIVVVGVLYMLVVGRRMIPERPTEEPLADRFGLRSFLAELHVTDRSPLAGSTLRASNLGRDHDLTVIDVLRADGTRVRPTAETVLEVGDRLLAEGASEAVLGIKGLEGLDLQADATFADLRQREGEAGPGLAEVVLLPGSPFVGRRPRGLLMRGRYQIQVLAISRRAGVVRSRIADTRMRLGDVLLVQGDAAHIAALQTDNAFDVLGLVEPPRVEPGKAVLVVGIFLFALTLGTLEVLPLAAAMLLGAVLVFVTGLITPDDAYRTVEWRILVLIASMLSLGTAMEHTGTATYLADQLVTLVGDLDPLWALTGFFVLTVALTQPMSNQAAAAVVVPLALQTALGLGLDPRPFAIMVAVAGSTSYLTPLEPACLMVYGPGRYRFADFIRVGGGLTLLVYGVAILLVPMIWPLRPG